MRRFVGACSSRDQIYRKKDGAIGNPHKGVSRSRGIAVLGGVWVVVINHFVPRVVPRY